MRALYRWNGTIKLCGDYPESISASITQDQANNKELYRVNPNTKAVYAIPTCDLKYRKVIDNVILEMTTAEKAVVDAEVAARAAAKVISDAARAAELATQAAKAQSIVDNLPSWAAVEAAIDGATTLAAMKVIFKKVCRVVYWDVKNTVL